MSALPAGVVLVTGNRSKLEEARRICGEELGDVELDLPEIQSLDLEEVLRAKGDAAWERLRRPLIVEETGFGLAALNGFPGPLVKWMLAAVGPEGIARAAHDLGDRAATARCALLYRDAERTVIASGEVWGRLVLPPRGDNGFGWDPVFATAGSERTFGEMSAAEKDELGHRGRAWRALLSAFAGGE